MQTIAEPLLPNELLAVLAVLSFGDRQTLLSILCPRLCSTVTEFGSFDFNQWPLPGRASSVAMLPSH